MKRLITGLCVGVVVLGGRGGAQLWESPQVTARQAVLKGFAGNGNVLTGGATRVTLDVVAGRVVGLLVEAPSSAGLARGVAAAWGLKEKDLPALVKQLGGAEVTAGARQGFVQPTDDAGQDVIAMKVTTGGAARWRAYLALNVRPDAAFPVTRNVSGQAGAPNTIRIFSDFQCPYCQELWEETLPGWEKQGAKYRVVHYQFPLEFHRNAFAAAEASECAGAQGKFWPLADRLFGEFARWTRAPQADVPGLFSGYARAAGLNGPAFEQCLKARTFRASVEAQVKVGAALGVNGTPTVFLNGVKLLNYTSQEEWSRTLAVTSAGAGVVIERRLREFR